VGVPELAIGAVSRHLGLLATALERWADAERHFAEAAALNARIGARPALWHARREHGEMLLARGEHGDAERARGLLEQALGAYSALGMETYAARASERLAGAVA
jgi:tetratricopeptide (TPR) repeat protein